MNRSSIREQAFKLLYSLEIQKDINEAEQIDLYLESNNIILLFIFLHFVNPIF